MNGSLLYADGNMNVRYKHGIAKDSSCNKTRISVTLRWIDPEKLKKDFEKKKQKMLKKEANSQNKKKSKNGPIYGYNITERISVKKRTRIEHKPG